MADKTVRGRFVWHELMTPDAPASQAFYSKVLGWKAQPSEEDPTYSVFSAGNTRLGGTMAAPSGMPHWLPYIGTADIEATVKQASELGAVVTRPIDAVPGGGRSAVLTDPQGGTFAVYSSDHPAGKESAPKRGEFSWHELLTTDYEAAFNFYSALFGWEKTAEHDMGDMGMYLIFGRNGKDLGGIFNAGPGGPGAPFWLGYVRVKDVNQAAKKAQKAGATLANGPMEVPGGDWIAQFTDPHGAMFAVHALKADLAPAAEAAASEDSGSADSLAETMVISEGSPQEVQSPPAAKKIPKRPAKKAAKPAAKKKAATTKAAAKTKSASKKKSAPAKKKSAKKSGKKKATGKVAKKGARKSAGKSARKSAKKGARKAAKVAQKRGGKKKAATKKARKGK